MKAFRVVLLLAGLAAAGSQCTWSSKTPAMSAAQKTIRISDSLAGHAERLDVTRDARLQGHIGKWRFGDYLVVSGKTGWTHTKTTGNFLQTESVIRTHDTFTFVLTNAATDSAIVNAARNVDVKTLHKIQLELGHGWLVGRGESAEESESFTALITINRDTTETWVLFLGSSTNETEGEMYRGKHEAYLTNGTRRIVLSLASSNENAFDFRGVPAVGYEFVEDGQSLCALQYFSGSLAFEETVWMHTGLDARTKLILAAAMTAIVQLRRP